jgi:hypothetical protein
MVLAEREVLTERPKDGAPKILTGIPKCVRLKRLKNSVRIEKDCLSEILNFFTTAKSKDFVLKHHF